MSVCLITFLGTSNYEEVIYSFNNAKEIKTPYIQEALIKNHLDLFKENDALLNVFMTDKAREKNWTTEQGLFNRIGKLIDKNCIKATSINEISEEDNLWVLFEQVFKAIPENCKVILDITHGFRTLPLFGLVLLNYARTLKKIKVLAIYYGAFEAKNNGKAPVIDLLRLDSLLRWGNAIETFIRHGNADGIDLLTKESVREELQKGYTETGAREERDLAKYLKQSVESLLTVRGNIIIEGKPFLQVKEKLFVIEQKSIYVKPLEPLHKLVKDSFELFLENSPSNILAAMDLCIKYGYIQQGITLMQEGIITLLLHIDGKDKLENRNYRIAVSELLQHLAEPEKYKEPCKDIEMHSFASSLANNQICKDLQKPYNRLRDLRNDINHAGFSSTPIKQGRFNNALLDAFKELLECLENNKKTINDIRIKNTVRKLLQKYCSNKETD